METKKQQQEYLRSFKLSHPHKLKQHMGFKVGDIVKVKKSTLRCKLIIIGEGRQHLLQTFVLRIIGGEYDNGIYFASPDDVERE